MHLDHREAAGTAAERCAQLRMTAALMRSPATPGHRAIDQNETGVYLRTSDGSCRGCRSTKEMMAVATTVGIGEGEETTTATTAKR
jgi:hypothetical protein